MRSSLVVRASDCQCTSSNGPVFDPSIRRHSGIWGAADEAVLNIVGKKKKKNPPKKYLKKKKKKKSIIYKSQCCTVERKVYQICLYVNARIRLWTKKRIRTREAKNLRIPRIRIRNTVIQSCHSTFFVFIMYKLGRVPLFSKLCTLLVSNVFYTPF